MTVTATPPYASLAAVLRRRRLRLGLSQMKLGLEVEIDSSEISRIESGRRNPHWSTLRRLAEGLGAPLSEIMGEVERLEAEKGSP